MLSDLELLAFYLIHSSENLNKSDEIYLLNKSGNKLHLLKSEIRKNQPILLTLSNEQNKLVYYNLDALTKAFISVVENAELKKKLQAFYTEKNNKIEAEKIRLQQEKDEKERKIEEAKRAEYRLKLEKSLLSHKSFLLANKIEYKGYHKSELLRKSNCYYCHGTVSSRANYECDLCNALICLCGKCLCVWNMNNKT